MGAWQTSVLSGVGAGVLAAALTLVLRRTFRLSWLIGGRLAVVVVVFVGLGALAPFLLPKPSVAARDPEPDPLGHATALLGSARLDDRVAAVHELEQLMRLDDFQLQPEVVVTLSTFVRERAPAAGCGSTGPAEDVELAVTVLGNRAGDLYDRSATVDLHGVCLARTDLRYMTFPGANLSGADLTGSSLRQTTLEGANLTRTRLTAVDFHTANLQDADLMGAELGGSSLTGVMWSDDTRWPPEHEQTVLDVSYFDTTFFVIRELRLPDQQ